MKAWRHGWAWKYARALVLPNVKKMIAALAAAMAAVAHVGMAAATAALARKGCNGMKERGVALRAEASE